MDQIIYHNTQSLETTGRNTEATLEDIGSGRGFLITFSKHRKQRQKLTVAKGTMGRAETAYRTSGKHCQLYV